jgi:hypothetical protein
VADDPKGPAADKPGEPPAVSEGEKLDAKLAAMEDRIVGKVKDMIGAGKQGEPAAGADQPGLGKMIDDAVAKVNADKAAADADAAHRKQHDDLAAAAAEKPPMERTRRHRFMGWGEPSQ